MNFFAINAAAEHAMFRHFLFGRSTILLADCFSKFNGLAARHLRG